MKIRVCVLLCVAGLLMLCLCGLVKAKPGGSGWPQILPREITITKEHGVIWWYSNVTFDELSGQIELGLREDGVVVWRGKTNE